MSAYSNKLGQIKIGIVHELWNQWLVDKLLLGVRKSLVEAGMDGTKQIVEIAVPGCWEVPCAASVLLPSVNAVICLSVLLRGETAHFDLHSKVNWHWHSNLLYIHMEKTGGQR
jgi:6,7-dimethyl-8-ribityllumazine synthase